MRHLFRAQLFLSQSPACFTQLWTYFQFFSPRSIPKMSLDAQSENFSRILLVKNFKRAFCQVEGLLVRPASLSAEFELDDFSDVEICDSDEWDADDELDAQDAPQSQSPEPAALDSSDSESEHDVRAFLFIFLNFQ